MKWIAFYSQTGSEIRNLSNKLGRDPDLIVTNSNKTSIANLPVGKAVYVLPNKPTLEQYEELFLYINKWLNDDDLFITLHGYLRIIPREICERYTIYNLHPGLINVYPELRGFNPQEKAYKMKLPMSGCVIHKVSPVVDGGEIIDTITIDIVDNDLDTIYEKLHDAAFKLWFDFIKDRLEVF